MYQDNPSDDKFYYNLTMANLDPEVPTKLSAYQVELDEAILKKPDDYYLAITRFSIPTEDIPIMISQIQPYPNTNPLTTIYSVTVEYKGATGNQIYLEHIPEYPFPPEPLLSPSHPVAPKSRFYYNYSYQNFITMINNALVVSTIAAGGPLAASGPYPYFQFNAAEQRMELVGRRSNFNTYNQPTDYYDIYVNNALATFMQGFEFELQQNIPSPIGKDVQIIIHDCKNNWYNPSWVVPVYPPDYFIMKQEYNTLPTWNMFKTLSVSSNLLPIRREFVPSPQSGNTVVNGRGILTDFEPITELGSEARIVCQYQPQGAYRLINFTTGVPLTKIDIEIFWTDQYGNQYPLYLYFNQVITMKLGFFKKSTFTS